jgi:hypothetical protein
MGSDNDSGRIKKQQWSWHTLKQDLLHSFCTFFKKVFHIIYFGQQNVWGSFYDGQVHPLAE